MKNHSVFEKLLNNIDRDIKVTKIQLGRSWVATVLENGHCGIAAKLYNKQTCEPEKLIAHDCRAVALSHNILSEDPFLASVGLATINACYNTTENVAQYQAFADKETPCTDQLDLNEKTVGIIGHMKRTYDNINNNFKTKSLFMFDQNPSLGDLPPEKESELLPTCDVLIITGTTLINHTIGEILQWSNGAQKIMTGPSVPFCPYLLEINRIHGMLVNKKDAFLKWNSQEKGSPLPFCTPFLFNTSFKCE